MNRRFWNAVNNAQEGIIFGSTSLKVKVELRVGGVAYECCSADSTAQAKNWVRAKTKEWHYHTPNVTPEFVTV